ncbi:MAG: tetratricopeptide repeat protein [Capsulimonadaceae bacterium]
MHRSSQFACIVAVAGFAFLSAARADPAPVSTVLTAAPTAAPAAPTTFHLSQTPVAQQCYDAPGNGDYDDAISSCTAALEADPGDAAAYNARGIGYLHAGKFDLAIADFTKSIDLAPDVSNPYYNRSNAYWRQGDYDHAIADLTKDLELDPKDVNAFNNRGIDYYHQHKLTEAISDYSHALEIDTNDEAAYYNRGVANIARADYNRAMMDLGRAILLKPNDIDAYYQRAVAFSGQDDFLDAARDLSGVLRLHPDYPGASALYGWSEYRLGHFKDAIKADTDAISLDATDADVLFHLALVYAVENVADKASATYALGLANSNPGITRAALLDAQDANKIHANNPAIEQAIATLQAALTPPASPSAPASTAPSVAATPGAHMP